MARECPPTHGFGSIIFEPCDINILTSDAACLNDTCINGCAALLYSKHLSPCSIDIAVFNTHDLSWIRYNADDNTVWHNTFRTRYWERDIWILPIHRPSAWGHWVMCTVHIPSCRLLLFDSLVEHQPWKKDLQVSVTIEQSLPSNSTSQDTAQLISRLSRLASKEYRTLRIDCSEWTAAPTTVSFPACATS